MFDWLIVGAGFAGSVLAERLASQLGDLVLLIDRRSHIGGNAYDRFDETGSLIPMYGRHVLQTDDADVLRYLSQFTSWRRYGLSGDGFDEYTPFHSSREAVVDRSIGRTQVDESDAFGIGSAAMPGLADFQRATRLSEGDVENINDLAGQMLIPAEGYTRMFEKMLSHPNIKLMLNSDYAEVRNIVPFRRLVYTGTIDEYFDYCYGKLPYQAVTADERGYPMAGMGGDALYRRYEELAEASADVFFIGRLATYKYCPMSHVVAQALATFDGINASADDPERRSVAGIARPIPSV